MEDEETTPEEEKAIAEGKPSIDDRIKELTEQKLSKEEIVLALYKERYSTHEIMKRHLPLKALKLKQKKKTEDEDSAVMSAVEGAVKGSGYLQEIKDMVRTQIGRTKELTDEFYNLGLGVLLASLRKSGISMDDFRKIAMQEGTLRDAFKQAGETVFKALEYFKSDLITRVEAERDEARAYVTTMETNVETLRKQLEPKARLEQMVYTYLLSGSVDPDVLISLIDKWLQMEIPSLAKVMA